MTTQDYSQKKLSKDKKDKIKKWIYFTLAGILLAFVTNYLIIYVEIYSPGLGGIAQGISYTINNFILENSTEQNKIIIYWAFYLVLNIPIIIFSFRNLGNKFTIYSLYVLFINLLFSMIFAYVPGFNEINFFPKADLENSEALKFVTYIIIGSISGVLYGVATGVTFKYGGSGLGVDPIVKYISKNKQVGMANIYFMIAITNTIFWTFLSSILANEITSFTTFLESFMNPKIFASIIYFIILSFVSQQIYSTKNKTMIEINSEKVDEISYYLKELKYHRNHTIYSVKGGWSLKERKVLKTIINDEEIKDVLNIVKNLDENAFIYTSKVQKIFGNFNSAPLTFEDIQLKEKIKQRKNKRNEGTKHNFHNLFNDKRKYNNDTLELKKIKQDFETNLLESEIKNITKNDKLDSFKFEDIYTKQLVKEENILTEENEALVKEENTLNEETKIVVEETKKID